MKFLQGMRLAVLWIATSPFLAAQELPGQAPPVRIAFRTLLLHGTLNGPHLRVVDEEGKPMGVEVFTTNLSHKTYEYRGPNPIVFYQEAVPVATFSVPEGMREMILFFIEQKEVQPGQPKFQIIALEADAAKFPLGSYLLINFSDGEVAAEIDAKLIRLKPGDQRLVALSHDQNTSIAARFAELRDGEWVRSYQVAWYFKPTARNMVFVTRDDDVDRSLRLRTITDRHFTPLPPDEGVEP